MAPSHPERQITIGPKLGGVTYDAPVELSWSSLRNGDFQKAVASRVTDAFPLRPLLIRVNNEVRSELFGEVTAPHVVRGAKGQLIERSYLDDYCSRKEGMGLQLAAQIIPKLKEIQGYYRARGAVFVYLISPSKAAHVPEYFLDRIPCPSTPSARTQLVPQYVEALKAAGINVLDTASLIHSLKGSMSSSSFPKAAYTGTTSAARSPSPHWLTKSTGRPARKSCHPLLSHMSFRPRVAPTGSWSICSISSFPLWAT